MPEGFRHSKSEISWIRFSLCLACAVLPRAVSAADCTVDQQIQGVFAQLRTLKEMAPGQHYTVRVSGKEEAGPKEQFLRRRTAEEICESGLTCGCGDYARVFISKVVPLGFDVLLVDGAEISMASLRDHFSGHSVVAIRRKTEPAAATWWLVDSTNLRLLERNWSPDAKSFEAFDRVFWIGYCGSLEDYPVHNPRELRQFYARTLAAVPREVLDGNICRLELTIDPSLVGDKGVLLNPRVSNITKMQSRVFLDYGIEPLRSVQILVMRGGDDDSGKISYSPERGWTCRLGLRSGCSPGFVSYLEDAIRRKYGPVFY